MLRSDASSSSAPSSAEQPPTSLRSAAQPASKKRARDSDPSGGASGSAARMEPAAKRAKAPFSAQSVAFITCADKAQDLATNHGRRALRRAVRHALEAGANIVNIAFSRGLSGDLVDLDCVLPDLKSEFGDVWRASVGQPAYSYRMVGSVMSFFSASCVTLLSQRTLDPEHDLPALMLTFNAPEGLLCTITTSAKPRNKNKSALAELLRQCRRVHQGGEHSHWRRLERQQNLYGEPSCTAELAFPALHQ